MKTLTFTFHLFSEIFTVAITRKKGDSRRRTKSKHAESTATGANWPEMIGIR